MPLIPVENLDDERLAPYRNLKDHELALAEAGPSAAAPSGERDSGHGPSGGAPPGGKTSGGRTSGGGQFLAEGEFIVRRLLASDFPVVSVLLGESRRERLGPLIPPEVPVYIVPDRAIDQIIGYKFHLGILAVGRRKPGPSLRDLLGPPSREAFPGTVVHGHPPAPGTLPLHPGCTLVICPEIINHDNVGSLIRISAGLGANAILLGERSCDPFWRRAIRVSMGAVFRLPILRSGDILADLRSLKRDWRVQLVATVLDAEAQPLRTATRPAPPTPLGILVGNEAQGLPPALVKLCDQKVTIPMAHDVDSLNIAVATAIVLYHFQP